MTGKRNTRAPRQKFTAEQEAEIYRLWADTALPAEEIAPRFGMTSDQLVWMARRHSWARLHTVNGKASVHLATERMFVASLARDRRISAGDNPRGETTQHPVPSGGFRMMR